MYVCIYICMYECMCVSPYTSSPSLRVCVCVCVCVYTCMQMHMKVLRASRVLLTSEPCLQLPCFLSYFRIQDEDICFFKNFSFHKRMKIPKELVNARIYIKTTACICNTTQHQKVLIPFYWMYCIFDNNIVHDWLNILEQQYNVLQLSLCKIQMFYVDSSITIFYTPLNENMLIL